MQHTFAQALGPEGHGEEIVGTVPVVRHQELEMHPERPPADPAVGFRADDVSKPCRAHQGIGDGPVPEVEVEIAPNIRVTVMRDTITTVIKPAAANDSRPTPSKAKKAS